LWVPRTLPQWLTWSFGELANQLRGCPTVGHYQSSCHCDSLAFGGLEVSLACELQRWICGGPKRREGAAGALGGAEVSDRMLIREYEQVA